MDRWPPLPGQLDGGHSAWRARSVAEFFLVYLVAVTLHAMWDGFGTFTAYGVLAVVSLLLLGIAVHRASLASSASTDGLDSDGRAFVAVPAT